MTNAFIIAAGLCIAAGGSLDFLKLPLESRRRLYWYLAFLAGVFVFLAAYPDPAKTLGAIGVVLIATVGWAYVHTPYIRIRGRIYAFQPMHINAESEDETAKLQRHEQIATPPKIWWIIAGFLLAFGVAMCCSFLPGREGFSLQHYRELILYMAGFCVLFAIGMGYGEAKSRYPIAQGQRLQFIIASIFSAGLFAMLYLTTYYLTTRAIVRPRE
ncbi:MAG: hypothetical protein WBH51_03955 [Mycolicibacter algericus]|uniref:hypothetical protein n=1 Tax=Mycolicibacter algericus TaxID=1288388 RepID=UPI003C72680D